MAGITDYIAGLFGGSPQQPPQQPVPVVSPMASFPSHEDADFANKYDYGYGRRTEPYMENKLARVLGAQGALNTPFQPRSLFELGLGPDQGAAVAAHPPNFTNVDLNDPKNASTAAGLKDTYARAALAANRDPIASLGFDPSKMTADLGAKGSAVNVSGSYLPSKDSIWFSANDDRNSNIPSTPVHESLHRGLNMLRDDPRGADAYNQLGVPEEYVVRYLMAKQMADPEKGNPQRDMGILTMDPDRNPKGAKALQMLQALAQTKINEKHPMGPN